MKTKRTNFIIKPFWAIIITLSLFGILTGILGFIKEGENSANSIYTTFQMFILHHSFHGHINGWLELSRWSIFFVFILSTWKVFITITAPRFIQYVKIRLFYHDHIVICGLNAICIKLIEKFPESKIVVIVEENNQHAESLKQRKIKLVVGNLADKHVLKTAGIDKASQFYAITDNDVKNVEIAQSVFAFFENEKSKNVLKCFVLVKDRELKTLIEETTLFKYKTGNFDGILININEMGVKYGICMNIDKILPANMKTSPEILVVGLTEKAENVILNLAHCLTMQRDFFRFTVVEKDEEIKKSFKEKYYYLWDFAEIEFAGEIKKVCVEKIFDSILVCAENQTEAIKQSVAIRYYLGKNVPAIFVFCDETDMSDKIFNKEGKLNIKGEKEVFTLKDRNIFPIDLFEKIADYVFVLDESIEKNAFMAHNFWNKLYGEKKEYNEMSGHLRQTNRNQILDNFLRSFIALGKSFNAAQESLVSFSDKDKETLAIMEHRRWMIEKFENGWRTGKRVKPDEFKRHDCLIEWDKLPENKKTKDFDAIDLMLHLLNSQKNEN